MGVEKIILKVNSIQYCNSGDREKMTDITELNSKNNNLKHINMGSKYITFILGQNTKNPSNLLSEWAKKHRHKWTHRTLQQLKEADINHGLPCGKINGLWVLDIDDYKDKEKCLFTKTFGDVGEYAKKHNIFTVRSASGGWHLYFLYNDWYAKNIKQTQTEHNLDIRSDGGFIVAPGSKVNGRTYEIFNTGVMAKCPPDLTIFLKNTLYEKKKVKKVRNKKIKTTNPITNEEVEDDEDNIDLGVYKYGFTDYQIKKIFNNLPDKFYTNYSDWLKMTTALKTLDKKDIWDEISKKHGGKSYNQEENEAMWECITGHNKLFMVNHILLNCKIKNARCMLDYYKYKPTPSNTAKPDKVVNSQKLGYEFFNENEGNCLAKSDTGTGKTTSFKKVAHKHPFISIVSRVSLGIEQMRIFKNDGIDVWWHEDISKECKKGAFWGMWEGDNIIITVDSLIKLQNWDNGAFSNYVIYLDEFNSLIKHLINCPTMVKTRQQVYMILLKLLKNCKRFIGTDADINDISLRYLQANNLEFNYIENSYKHNKGVEATEIFSFNKFIKAVNSEDKWLICCDSKTQSEVIAHINASTDYLLITSDGWLDSKTKQFIKGEKNLDSHDRVIYSPAVLYGLDSVMKRPVFCYYKCQTIDPEEMIQQICRCRNITYVKYLFARKKWLPYKYHDFSEIVDEIKEYQQYGYKLFDIMQDSQDLVNENDAIYLELLAKYKYREDCYNTNKLAHFISMMRRRGFKCPLVFTQTGVKGVKDAQKEVRELKEEDLKNMDDLFNNTEQADKKAEDFYAPAFIKVNEILKIPYGELYQHKDMFLFTSALSQHLTITDYFTKSKEELEVKLQDKDDYIVNLTTTYESKLLTITKFKNACQDYQKEKTDIYLDKPLDKKTADIFLKEYSLVFRHRSKKQPDFTDIKTCQQYLVKMYKACFSPDVITSKKSTKNGKSNTTYTLDTEFLDYHNELYLYRKPVKVEVDMDDSSDEE